MFNEERTRPMNAMSLRINFGLTILAATAVADPQPLKAKDDSPAEKLRIQRVEDSAKTLAHQYEQHKKQFFAAQEKANSVMVNRFDAALKQIRAATRLAAELRRAKLKKISDEKSAFTANGKLPLSDEMLMPLLEYQEALHKARVPVAQTFEKLFNIYSVKLKDDARADKLTADKEAFDQKSRGRTVFQRSNWQGTQYGSNNIPFALNVYEMEGNSLKGAIVQDRPPNETVFQTEGLLSGNRIQFKSTKVVQGKSRTLLFTGYVMENRILGQVVSVDTNGKASSPRLALLYKR
jgi:hypothetical protein